MCEQIAKLKNENAELRKCLSVFAAIKPSSFFAPDGSENEGYLIYVFPVGATEESVAFTGKDLARARELTR